MDITKKQLTLLIDEVILKYQNKYLKEYITCDDEKYRHDVLLTNGGRVLTVVNIDKDFWKAKKKVYEDIEHIEFENKYFRKDIGYGIKYFLEDK
jgi:phosphoribosylamine-glycine ligase